MRITNQWLLHSAYSHMVLPLLESPTMLCQMRKHLPVKRLNRRFVNIVLILLTLKTTDEIKDSEPSQTPGYCYHWAVLVPSMEGFLALHRRLECCAWSLIVQSLQPESEFLDIRLYENLYLLNMYMQISVSAEVRSWF